MIGLAVGIDYTLFILSRHRTQLAAGMDPEESAARATGTAGSAVVFAGLTVVIALSGLAVVGIPFLTVMGVGAAGTVLVAVLVALTLLPALLGFAGRAPGPEARLPGRPPRAGRRRRRRTGARRVDGRPLDPAGHPPAAAHRARRPRRARRPGDSRAAAAAGPARQLHRGAGEPGAAGLRPDQRELRARPQRPAGRAGRGPRPGDRRAGGRRDRRRRRGHAHRHAGRVRRRSGRRRLRAAHRAARRHHRDRHRHPGERAAGGGDERPRRRAPGPGAPSSRRETGADLAVTGQTAVAIDVSDRLGDALLPFALVVVGLALVLLLLVFRSILVPIKAAVGFLLSVGASFGAVVAVFQWGWFNDLLGRARHRPGHQLPAGAPDGGAVRAGDGLRGLPRLPDARGVRARRRAPRRRRHRGPARGAGRRRGGADHVRGLRQLRDASRTSSSRRSPSAWPSASWSTPSWSG